jgi:preprotein translocase subunit YajC
MKEMQAAITTGDNVVTSGGMFGKVADIGEDCFIVEFGTNRSIRIPVLKSDVIGIREPKMTPPPKIEAD